MGRLAWLLLFTLSSLLLLGVSGSAEASSSESEHRRHAVRKARLADAKELLHRGNHHSRFWRPRARAQRRCQRVIERSGYRFLRARLREHRKGVRSYAASQQKLNPITNGACNVAVRKVRGRPMPALGGVCAGVGGAVGERFDAAAASLCLRRSLGRIANEISPKPFAPNILVVMTDDQRWDTTSVMPEVVSRVIAEGVEFTESFVTTSLCCPSRASFLSGQYASTTGIQGQRPDSFFPGGAPLFDDSVTIATELSAAGYRTALFGKYMNATDLLTEPPAGWDRFHAFVADGFNFFDYTLNEDGVIVPYGSQELEYSTDLLAGRALDFIDAQSPFFVMYTPYAPHFDATFWNVTPAPRHLGTFQGIAPWRPESFREPDLSDKPPHIQNNGHGLWDNIVASGEFDQFRVEQFQSLLSVDEAIGALIDRLDELAIADHTVIVFTSDNGYMMLEHHLSGKNVPYEESIRVPLLIRYPLLVPTPHQSDELVVNLDVAPTLLELAGVDVPEQLEGASLVQLLDRREQAAAPGWRTEIFGEHFEIRSLFSPVFANSTNAYVRTHEWKYVRHEPFFEELYDLVNDPLELDNRASESQYEGVLGILRGRLDEFLANQPDE